jgi:phenylacetate-CoA ligase
MLNRSGTSVASSRKIIHSIETKKSIFWEKLREEKALELFHETARKVPAYKDFLKKNHINHERIKTFKDFQLVPPVSKKNYLTQYPLEKIVWDRSLCSPLVWTATSGSTGRPFYFPRSVQLDWEASIVHELFIKNSLHNAKEPTLVLICFGMGVWIGGLITYKAYEIAAQREGYPISILTPGINKKEILNAFRQLAPNFSQTILIGYAPFVKDVLEAATNEKIDLKKLNLRLHFAAEAFTENFRDYLAKVGKVKDVCLDTMNIYGSADIGAMAFETPLSILIRRFAVKNGSRNLFNSIFSNITKTPTLAQYNPFAITFEAPDGEILLTGNNTIPLVRYSIGDHGGALSFSEVKQKLKDHGISLRESLAQHGLEKYAYELPFVFVYERMDFSTTLYGLQIYPEHIREALIHPLIHNFLTGKLTMATKFTKQQDQYLEINLELRKNVKLTKAVKKLILDIIVQNLEKTNSEFRELHRFLDKRAHPNLVFWPAEDPQYFRPGVKQQWVKKQ